MRSSTHWKRTLPPRVEASGVLFGRTSLCASVGLWGLYQLERVAFTPSTKLPKMGKHPARLIYGFVLGVNNQWVQRLNAYTSSWPNFMKKQRSVCQMASTPTNAPDKGKTDSTPQKWIVIMSSTCPPEPSESTMPNAKQPTPSILSARSCSPLFLVWVLGNIFLFGSWEKLLSCFPLGAEKRYQQ